jgi:hypothetical protein
MRKPRRAASVKQKADAELLEESLRVSRLLQRTGISARKSYSLRSPFEKRLFRVSAAELILHASTD